MWLSISHCGFQFEMETSLSAFKCNGCVLHLCARCLHLKCPVLFLRLLFQGSVPGSLSTAGSKHLCLHLGVKGQCPRPRLALSCFLSISHSGPGSGELEKHRVSLVSTSSGRSRAGGQRGPASGGFPWGPDRGRERISSETRKAAPHFPRGGV